MGLRTLNLGLRTLNDLNAKKYTTRKRVQWLFQYFIISPCRTILQLNLNFYWYIVHSFNGKPMDTENFVTKLPASIQWEYSD